MLSVKIFITHNITPKCVTVHSEKTDEIGVILAEEERRSLGYPPVGFTKFGPGKYFKTAE